MPILRCNNANLFYTESGSGSESIIFSHGLLFNHHQWDFQVAHFEKNYQCITYDHRGQGKSELTGSMDMDTLFEDVASLIQQLSPGKPLHFVGLSMGGFAGMRLAARKPHLLKSLTLMETSADPEINKFRYEVFGWIFKNIGPRIMSKKIIKILFGKTFVNDPAKKELLNYWKSQIESYPPSITRALEGVIYRKSIYDEIANIKVPTLVMVGEEDVATNPEKAVRIHGQIKNSSMIIIPGAGHSSCLEQPEKVNQLIENFIQKI